MTGVGSTSHPAAGSAVELEGERDGAGHDDEYRQVHFFKCTGCSLLAVYVPVDRFQFQDMLDHRAPEIALKNEAIETRSMMRRRLARLLQLRKD
jgi:hypothetical protein